MNQILVRLRSKKIEVSLLALLVIAITSISFRNILFKGSLIGSEDFLLAILMTEHWYKVILGIELWESWISYYPVVGSVAFNDMYVLHSIPYCLFRFIGLDMYKSMTYSIVILYVIGLIYVYKLLRKNLYLMPYTSFLGMILFGASNYFLIKLLHCQFIALILFPVIIHYVIKYFRDINYDSKRYFHAIKVVVMVSLLFYTSPYLGVYLLIFILIYGVSFLFVVRNNLNLFYNLFSKWIKTLYKEIIAYLILGLIIMMPFIKVYFPLFHQNKRSFDEALFYCYDWYEIFNVGPQNKIYGALMQKLGFTFNELTVGIPIFELIILIVATLYILKVDVLKFSSITEEINKIILLKALVLSMIVCYLLAIKFQSWSLWYIFYKFMPGASGIRVVGRIALLNTVFISIIVPYTMDCFIKTNSFNKVNRYVIDVIMIIMPLIIFVENIQNEGIPSNWCYKEAIVREAIFDIKPPENCNAFYVYDGGFDAEKSISPSGFYRGFLDAWLIANKYNIPTINGFASYIPDGYGCVYNIYSQDYLNDVNNWIVNNKLSNIYCYDLSLRKWIEHNEVIEDVKNCSSYTLLQ